MYCPPKKPCGDSQVGNSLLVVKNLPANAGDARDAGLILRLGRSPGEGNANPLQYSCLENLMDRGAWQATVHEVARVRHNLVTKPTPYTLNHIICVLLFSAFFT